MSKFNNRFWQLKEEKNISAKDLSSELKIPASTLSNYFKDREPSYDILIKIANYFDVTTDWLVGRIDERNGLCAADYLAQIEGDVFTDVKEPWLETGYVNDTFSKLYDEADVYDEFDGLDVRINDFISGSLYEAPFINGKVLLTAYTQLFDNLEEELDLTALLISIPVNVAKYLTDDERKELKEELLRLFNKYHLKMNDKKQEIAHAKALSGLERKNLDLIGKTLKLKIQELNNVSAINNDFADTTTEYLDTVLSSIEDFCKFDINSRFKVSKHPLLGLLQKCVKCYNSCCTRYELEQIPENEITSELEQKILNMK